jgi:hypothetical protein
VPLCSTSYTRYARAATGLYLRRISDNDLKAILGKFSDVARVLHRQNIDDYVQTIPFLSRVTDPYQKLPVPFVITQLVDGRRTFEHDPELLADKIARVKQIVPPPGTILPPISSVAEVSKSDTERPELAVEYDSDPEKYHTEQILASREKRLNDETETAPSDPQKSQDQPSPYVAGYPETAPNDRAD